MRSDSSTASSRRRRERVSSLGSCVLNLTNTIVGSGLLGLPKAFENAGSTLGCVFLILFASLSAFGLHLLASSARLCNSIDNASFRAVAEVASPRFSALIDAAVAIKCFGVATSYLIVIGDVIPRVIHIGSRRFWILFSTLGITPLCLFEKLDGLKFTSALSLLFVAYLTTMIVVYRYTYGNCGNDCTKVDHNFNTSLNLTVAKTLTIFVFGFTCHQNIFACVAEIKSPTPQRINTVIITSLSIAGTVYFLVAWSGYHTFGTKVQGDILENYHASPAVSIARLFVAALVAFSYPLQCHPSRHCFLSLLDHSLSSTPKKIRASAMTQEEEELTLTSPLAVSTNRTHSLPSTTNQQALSSNDNHPLHETRHTSDSSATRPNGNDINSNPEVRPPFSRNRRAQTLTTLGFILASLVIALYVHSLTIVLAIVGATGSTMVSYVLPGGIYYRLAPPSLKRSCALALFVLGLCVIPTALSLIFVST